MTEHRLLTGASLHEPKGVETATAGQVYIANGSGSGSWQSPLTSVINLNRVVLGGTITNLNAANSSFFLYISGKSNLTRVSIVLNGTITTANNVLTIYKNGIAQTPTITIPYTGSGPGVTTNVLINPPITFNDGDTLELRTNGASGGTVAAAATLTFTATT